MSLQEEPRITCPRCGRSVPAMVYCIYCGARLRRPSAPPVAPKAPPRVVPKAPPPPPVTAPPRAPAPPQAPAGVTAEIHDLMSKISIYQDRKVSLLNLFQSGEVSERVFVKLYTEYSGKLNEMLNRRVSKLEELRAQLGEKSKRLDEIKFSLEELEARYKVGEIDSTTFEGKSRDLKAEVARLESEMKDLKANIEHLEKVFADKSPREILNMEMKIKSFQESLDKFVNEGRLSKESVEKIKPDIEETLAFFDSIIGKHKERERQLREQLEALHARYRVSEISIEEYERKKREIQEEIDKIWREP
ncbi:hypothetical protein B6U84_04455 [Candidatus Bathyarchaeota archaeon ex4484_40]|nr:MAG: hypothetical protein B6U84_04455 [Candidatus Bathyarchaeota archaeon ex4484_40]